MGMPSVSPKASGPCSAPALIPGTGVCMNNFLNWGDLERDSRTSSSPVAVGMCLAPSLSTQGGEAVLALGTPGSYGICQTQSQAMVHHLEYGLDLQAAIDAPRARLWDGSRVQLESRVEDAVSDRLVERGHALEMIKPFSMSCGSMRTIRRNPESGALFGAADNRRDGAAVPA